MFFTACFFLHTNPLWWFFIGTRFPDGFSTACGRKQHDSCGSMYCMQLHHALASGPHTMPSPQSVSRRPSYVTTPGGELANPTKMCPAIIPTTDRKSIQTCDGDAVRESQVRRICPSRPSRVG